MYFTVRVRNRHVGIQNRQEEHERSVLFLKINPNIRHQSTDTTMNAPHLSKLVGGETKRKGKSFLYVCVCIYIYIYIYIYVQYSMM